MEELFTLSPLALGAIPVTIGIVQVLKLLIPDSKYAPVVALAIGIGLMALTGIAWQAFIVQGLIVGLAASGLYSGTKSVLSN